MKSPIKNKTYDTKSLHQLLTLIPEGSVVDSYLFFGGDLEMSLSKYNRFVCARTTQYVVYEFWRCLMENPNKLYSIATSEHFKFDEVDLPYMQKKWAHFKDQYMRSAMFFLLNKCTGGGQISYGEIKVNMLSHADLADLKTFRKPKDLHLIYDQGGLEQSLTKPHGEYIVVSAGDYKYEFMTGGKAAGLEETEVDHEKLFEFFNTTDKKNILIYNYRPNIIKKYKDISETMLLIDKYGNTTDTESNCHEVIIANF